MENNQENQDKELTPQGQNQDVAPNKYEYPEVDEASAEIIKGEIRNVIKEFDQGKLVYFSPVNQNFYNIEEMMNGKMESELRFHFQKK